MYQYDFHSQKININHQKTRLYWSRISLIQRYHSYWYFNDRYFLSTIKVSQELIHQEKVSFIMESLTEKKGKLTFLLEMPQVSSKVLQQSSSVS